MSRRNDPDRKSKRAKPPEDAEDLPMLEAIADELEQVASGDQVEVRCAAAGEPGFDTALTVSVPAMDKQAMAEAVAAALRRAAAASPTLVRNHRVVTVFTGDTIIGTAVKDTVGAVLREAKARKIVVRRGYGDELLHDAPPPRAQVEKKVVGDTVRVEVATGELEAADLPAALQQELVGLVSNARGQRFLFSFTGGARPDAALRDLLSRTLGDAGALRAAIGERVLFDRELEARVRISARGDDVGIEVAPAETEVETVDALTMVLAPAVDRLSGKVVTLQWKRQPRAQELAHALSLCTEAGPRRLEVVAGGVVDVVLPRLIEVDGMGDEARLNIAAGGRDRAGVAMAFARECRELHDSLRGKVAVLDWPAEPAVEPGLADECARQAVEILQPKALLRCTDGGDREPVWPAPFAVGSDGAVRTVRIDTDAGKPAQLLLAIERRLPAAIAGFRGAAARLQFSGSAAPSRTLQRTLVSLLENAGVHRLEVDDHGAVDLVLPPLLRVVGTGPELRIAANPAGRDAAQVEAALQRELAGIAFPGAAVAIADSPLGDRLLALAIERGAAKVTTDGREPVQLHPPLLALDTAGDRLVVKATPGDDGAAAVRQLAREMPALLARLGSLEGRTVVVQWPAAAAADGAGALVQALVAKAPAKLLLDGGNGVRQLHPEVVREYVALLGRKDDGAAPLLMLAIDAGDEPDHLDKVLARLAQFADLLPQRRVLLVGRTDEGERALADGDALLDAVRAVVDPVAAATLVYRGLDGRGRPHFTVAHSNDAQLAVGAAFADPRGRR